MNLKFNKYDLAYEVFYDGLGPTNEESETVGIVPIPMASDERVCFKLDSEHSGILEFEEFETIYNFMRDMQIAGKKKVEISEASFRREYLELCKKSGYVVGTDLAGNFIVRTLAEKIEQTGPKYLDAYFEEDSE